MNSDLLTLEVLRGLSGSIGIIFTVPLVVGISAYFLSGRGKSPQRKNKGKFDLSLPHLWQILCWHLFHSKSLEKHRLSQERRCFYWGLFLSFLTAF
jgi:hypothetical protein